MTPLLEVDGLVKQYRRGWRRRPGFRLTAHFTLAEPTVLGVLGPNGSGKTPLFELITGSNRPSSGQVRVAGRDIHGVKASERDRLAIHYHQSYQVRRFKPGLPDALLAPAGSDYPLVHLFDEPQFSLADGYVGFMLRFFAELRAQGRLVVLCLHPNEPWHVELLRETCERFLFVHAGTVTPAPTWDALVTDERARAYLGTLAEL